MNSRSETTDDPIGKSDDMRFTKKQIYQLTSANPTLNDDDFTYLNPTPGEEEHIEMEGVLRGARADGRNDANLDY